LYGLAVFPGAIADAGGGGHAHGHANLRVRAARRMKKAGFPLLWKTRFGPAPWTRVEARPRTAARP
jgi:hypothetical protein